MPGTTARTYTKGVRLCRTGKVHPLGAATDDHGRLLVRTFEVEGDSGTHAVRWDDWGIECDCPSNRRCSHEIAVTLFDDAWRGEPISGNVVDHEDT